MQPGSDAVWLNCIYPNQDVILMLSEAKTERPYDGQSTSQRSAGILVLMAA